MRNIAISLVWILLIKPVSGGNIQNLYEIIGGKLGNFVTGGYDLCVLITKECDVIPPTKTNQTPKQLTGEERMTQHSSPPT